MAWDFSCCRMLQSRKRPEESATWPLNLFTTRFLNIYQGCWSGPFSAGSGKAEFYNWILIWIQILLAQTKNQFKHLICFQINQISSDIFMLIFLPEKVEKFTWKCVQAPFFCIFPLFIQLYIVKVRSGSGENFLNPGSTKRSGSATLIYIFG